MSENTNGALTPKEIRENNIALLRSHGQEVPHNISKANLEKLIAELNDSPDENNTSIENATLENENTSDKDVKIVPEVDIVWADAEGGILKKDETYTVSSEGYKRIKHLVKKA